MSGKQPSAETLASIGECCGGKCRNCPYKPKHGGARASLPDRLKHLVRLKKQSELAP